MTERALPRDDLTKAIMVFEEQPSGLYVPQWLKGTAGAVHVVQARKLSGEEDETNEHDSRVRYTEDWKWTRLAAGTTEQLIYAGACRTGPILYDAGTTPGNVTLRDAAATGGSNTLSIVGGSTRDTLGLRCANGLTAQAATTGAGVLIGYREAILS